MQSRYIGVEYPSRILYSTRALPGAATFRDVPPLSLSPTHPSSSCATRFLEKPRALHHGSTDNGYPFCFFFFFFFFSSAHQNKIFSGYGIYHRSNDRSLWDIELHSFFFHSNTIPSLGFCFHDVFSENSFSRDIFLLNI